MKIGQLARAAGVTPDTIRFYEREGLIAAPPRTAAGYRQYEATALEDLRFIRKGQALGLRLAEIRDVLAMTAEGHIPCGHVHAAISARLQEVELRMSELRTLRQDLKRTLKRLETTEVSEPGCRCSAIEEHT